ncbi:TniQ family protein [Roseomonas chloroacetimidivorans]|uniref:TniQ family protein n=1 Tax=Roseomonas chloroacetimidivorans TaxID=1766656 RepID=UPI003C772D9A
MRAGQGTFQPGSTLPIVPPPEDDELISSWLDRTARFYGQPLQALLNRIAPAGKPIDLAAVDLGHPRRALSPVAKLLGLSLDGLLPHTVAAAYPRAGELIAFGAARPDGFGRPRLRYAACPHCLEQQRADRGICYLRRAWVMAPRTVCSLHRVTLVEGRPGTLLHPALAACLRRHQRSDNPLCHLPPGVDAVAHHAHWAPDTAAAAALHQQMAELQDGILALAAGNQANWRYSALEERALIVSDLVWAFTRTDHPYRDRLLYEAFASPLPDNPWILAQRRRPGPAAFRRLHVTERHLLMATASVLTGPSSLRQAFLPSPGNWQADLETLGRRLGDDDRRALAYKKRKWSSAWQGSLPAPTGPVQRAILMVKEDEAAYRGHYPR